MFNSQHKQEIAATIKKCCPSCNQIYQIKCISNTNGNIPLFLTCGHTMCENCIKNIVKFDEPFVCKICNQDIHFDPDDIDSYRQNKTSLYFLFPINIYMIGELTSQEIRIKNEPKNKGEEGHFIDIKKIIKNTGTVQGACIECLGSTSKMCEQCGIIVCNNCFNKSHKNFVIFKNHALKDIDEYLQKNTCKVHQDKSLDYFCKDCCKPICMDCLMVGGEKTCKGHNISSIQEVNENFLVDLSNLSPKVDEIYLRLTKTALDVGHLLSKLTNDMNNTNFTHLLNRIDQHFSKLFSVLQKQKENITQQVCTVKNSKIECLKVTKNKIAENIKKAKNTLNAINSLDPGKLKELNLSAVLENAKEIIKVPWYLNEDQSEATMNVKINEEIFSLINDYITLEGNSNSAYNLLNTEELIEKNVDIPTAPTSVIFPPEICKDVREMNKPKNKEAKENEKLVKEKMSKFRNKNGSCTSLNSISSDNSLRTYLSYENKSQANAPNEDEQELLMPLVEGAQELIYISHIVSPQEMYVQRARLQPHVRRLLRGLPRPDALPRPAPHHPAVGKVYLVYNKVDKFWQRGRVMKIDRKDENKPIFHVFCIDFGSTITVTLDILRLIPAGLINSPPPFAIGCALHNCEPVHGSWDRDDSLLIQNIIDNKQAVLAVRRAGGARLQCDVTAFEDGVNVAHALAFHGRARLPLNYNHPKPIGVTDNVKIFMCNYDCKKNSIEEVYMTHIVSPDNFHVRELHLQSAFEKLCEDLDQEYSLSVKTGSIYLPEKNMACVANVEKCAVGVSWARALVTELPGRARVRLLLPDLGARVLVHWTALRRILKRFTMQRALAKECHLAGVTPLNKKWNANSVSLLESFKGKVLELHVEDNRNRTSLGVTLYDKSDDENIICINTQMIKYKFAVSFGIFMFNRNGETDEIVHTKASPPLHEQKMKDKPTKTVQTSKRETAGIEKSKEDEHLEAKDKGPLRLEVKVLNYQSPSFLYVSIVHQQKVFNELFEAIQNYYTQTKTQGRTDWEVGDKCCTICNKSQTWRRVTILEIIKENAKVFYSDFACVDTVALSSLRDIPEELASVGDGAILCHLSGVTPAVGDEWPSLTKEYLKELLEAYQRIFVTKLGDFKDKSMPIELWVYHTIQGGALEPNISEWRCLNKKIIEQGLGIPYKSQSPHEKDNCERNAGDDTLSFLNITGSLKDWLQIEPIPLKPLKNIISNADSDFPLNSMADGQEPECSQNTNTMFISDWLPPEPLANDEFTGVPTYIDNDGVIYLHDISQQDTLDLIRKSLDVRFINPDPKARFCKWTVGEPCAALYFLDNCFYRGRVIEVNNEASTCLIHYIDYGNEEVCSFEHLRKTIVLHQIPVQAHRCVFHRIRPVNGRWDRQSLDYTHKSIVEKQCFIKVSGNPIGGLIPIELKYDKLWINDHLVDFEMAVYTDGSKAIIRKFAPVVTETQFLESDSGPDYIVEEDDLERTINSDKSSEGELVTEDWIKMMDEKEVEAITIDHTFMTYTPFTDTEFECNVAVINVDKLELAVIHNEAKNKVYDNMFEQLQDASPERSPLKGIYKNKACIALFPDDEKWYRAIVIQYSESKGRIKVKYVDYGNVEVLSLAQVKEISEKYTRLPPAAVTATLHGVKINPDINKVKLLDEYTNTFIEQGPFHAQVIDDSDIIPSVELRDGEGNLVYENLIQQNILIRN